jgi:hypothetical protein
MINGSLLPVRLHVSQDHLNVCPFFEVPCPLGKCKERVMRKDISDHLGFKCKHRESSCEYCKHKMPLSELQVQSLLLLMVHTTWPSINYFTRGTHNMAFN